MVVKSRLSGVVRIVHGFCQGLGYLYHAAIPSSPKDLNSSRSSANGLDEVGVGHEDATVRHVLPVSRQYGSLSLSESSEA